MAKSKYKPEYCKLLIEHMNHGLSFEAFAGVVSVNRQTLYNWRAKHADFQDAFSVALEKARLWWEKKGIDALHDKSINAVVWIYTMKSRFREEWGERVDAANHSDLDNETAKSLIEQHKKLLESQKP